MHSFRHPQIINDLQTFKLPKLNDLINTITVNNAYEIKENFDSYSIIDIPPDIINLHNPEGMSSNWLTGCL